MSYTSQTIFKHSIQPDNSINPRISIALRMLKSDETSPSNTMLNANDTCSISSINLPLSCELAPSQPTLHPLPSAPEIVNPNPPVSVSTPLVKVTNIYISSSMFRGLCEKKLSSTTQNAVVFSYPGATARGILHKLQNDVKFSKIDKTQVSKVFLLCGTNNVDQILDVKHINRASFINHHQSSVYLLDKSKSDISNLIDYLHHWSNTAAIHTINILPRESATRNYVINELNNHLKEQSMSKDYVKFVSTEFERNLFTFSDGHRKNNLFHPWGSDNVHLNSIGIIKLAKHLKYYAHK